MTKSRRFFIDIEIKIIQNNANKNTTHREKQWRETNGIRMVWLAGPVVSLKTALCGAPVPRFASHEARTNCGFFTYQCAKITLFCEKTNFQRKENVNYQ
jgi:hypothetical protein